MPDKPVRDNDPIVTKSYAAHYMVAVALLTATLLWALWDEAFGCVRGRRTSTNGNSVTRLS